MYKNTTPPGASKPRYVRFHVERAVMASPLPMHLRYVMLGIATLADGTTGVIAGYSLSELSDRLNVERSHLARNITKLVKDGWLHRDAPSSADARRGAKTSYALTIPRGMDTPTFGKGASGAQATRGSGVAATRGSGPETPRGSGLAATEKKEPIKGSHYNGTAPNGRGPANPDNIARCCGQKFWDCDCKDSDWRCATCGKPVFLAFEQDGSVWSCKTCGELACQPYTRTNAGR